MIFPPATHEQILRYKGNNGRIINHVRIYIHPYQTIIISDLHLNYDSMSDIVDHVIREFQLNVLQIAWIEYAEYREGFDLVVFDRHSEIATPEWISVPRQLVECWIKGESFPQTLFYSCDYKPGLISSLYLIKHKNKKWFVLARSNQNAFHLIFEKTSIQSLNLAIESLNPLVNLAQRCAAFRLRLQGKEGIVRWDRENKNWIFE